MWPAVGKKFMMRKDRDQRRNGDQGKLQEETKSDARFYSLLLP